MRVIDIIFDVIAALKSAPETPKSSSCESLCHSRYVLVQTRLQSCDITVIIANVPHGRTSRYNKSCQISSSI